MHMKEWQENCGFITDVCDSVLDSGRTMHDLFNIITEDKSKIIYSWDDNGRRAGIRRDAFAWSVASAARTLVDMVPADRKIVGLHLVNHHMWPVFYWAILMSGHIPVVINSRSELFQYRNIKECKGISIITKDKKYPFAIAPETLRSNRYEVDLAYFDNMWEDETLFVGEKDGEFSLIAHNGLSLTEQILRLRYAYREEQFVLTPKAGRVSMKLPFSEEFGFIMGMVVYPCYGYEINIPKPGISIGKYILSCRSMGVTNYCVSGRDCAEFVHVIAKRIERAFAREAAGYLQWLNGTRKVNDYRTLTRYLAMSMKIRKVFFGKKICCFLSGDENMDDTAVTFLDQLGTPFVRCLCIPEAGLLTMDLSVDHEARRKNSMGKFLAGVSGKVTAEGFLETDCGMSSGRYYTCDGIKDIERPFATDRKVMIDRDGQVCLEKAGSAASKRFRSKPDPKVLGQVREVYSVVLNKPLEIIDDDMDFFSELGGDSLTYFLLLRHLEVRFGIKIRNDDSMFFSTVRFAAETLRSYKTQEVKENEET